MVGIFFIAVVFQQDAEVVTVGQPAFGRKANSDSVYKGSRKSTAPEPGQEAVDKKGVAMALQTISSSIFSPSQVRI